MKLLRTSMLVFFTAASALVGPSFAAVHPFVAPAHGVCVSLNALAQGITAAVADGKVTPAEKAALVAAVTRLQTAVDRLVAAQGAPASAALATVMHHLNANTVSTRGPFLALTVKQASAQVWIQAKKDRTTNPFSHLHGYARVSPGVVARRLAVHGTSWVVAGDLAQPRLRLMTNALRMSGHDFVSVRVDELARAGKSQAAINGDFFSRKTPHFRPSSYAMSNGQVWPGTDGSRFAPSVVWSAQHVMILPPHQAVPSWARNVVSARPLALAAGKVVTHFSEPDKAARSRRTGVGLSADGRVLYFVSSTSATATDIGSLLRSAGAHDGFTMDAGGSAQLYVARHGLAQESSDPARVRRVANVLLLHFK